jgi:glycosyltransferase involved in cell wall biosynthesis
MKLTYIANARIPSEKAHPYQILKTCEALATKTKVELIVPFRIQVSKRMKRIHDVWEYYGIKKKFKITKLPSIDLQWMYLYTRSPKFWMHPYTRSPKFWTLTFYIQAISFAIIATVYALLTGAKLIYLRAFFTCVMLRVFKVFDKKIFYEAHDFPKSKLGKKMRLWAFDKINGLVVITNGLKELYMNEGIPEEKILVAPDCVDLKLFEKEISKEAARNELKIPTDKKIICYTGHLYSYEGVYELAKSMKYLDGLCVLYVVGGIDQDIARFKRFVKDYKIPNVKLVGYVAPTLVPKYLASSDVVVLPVTSGGETLRGRTMSPLKLFEYMASRRPIVASNLPSIREILNEKNAILVEPGNSKALAEGIKKALGNEERAKKIAENAYRDVQQYTWVKRAEKILKFMGER